MNIHPSQVLGGIFEDLEFREETSIASSVANGVGEFFESITSLSQDITGVESSEDSEKSAKFPSKGTIEFNKKQEESEKKQKTETQRKKAFIEIFKEDQQRAQRAKDMMWFEEEINDIATNLPTDQKNVLLHYQASYKDRSVYQKAELRKKLIEQKQKEDEKEKAASIPSPAKQANALETQFEGGTGQYGGGSANLSSASGAVG